MYYMYIFIYILFDVLCSFVCSLDFCVYHTSIERLFRVAHFAPGT